MSQRLIIWLPERLDTAWAWYISPTDFGLAETDAQKQELSQKDAQPIHVILPGQWVRILDYDLPAMKDTERKTAIRFFVEEQIAASVDAHHIVLSAHANKHVAIITMDKMKLVMAALKAAGINPDNMYADFDCLRHEMRPLALEDRIIVPQAGYTVDPDWGGDKDAQPVTIKSAKIEPATIDKLSESLNTDKAINLRTQEFARRSKLRVDFQQYAHVAMLLVALGFSVLLWQGMQARALQQNAQYLRAQAGTVFAKATGKPIPPNPALVVTRAIKNDSAQTADFLALSNLLFSAVSDIDGITIETLQFDAHKNQLTLRLTYPAFESASELERVIAANGGVFRSGGVREYNGQLIGDAVLTSGKKS